MADDDHQQSFTEVLAETKTRLAGIARLRSQAEEISVTETSADGSVAVTVNSGGVMTDLRISDGAARDSGARLAAVVLATMRRAQAHLGSRLDEMMQDTISGDQETRKRILAVYCERFPEQEPAEESAPSPASESAWDNGNGSILR